MMVRFSCFNAHIHCHKPKKTFQPSVEAMQHNLEDSSQIQAPSGSPESKSLSPSFLKPGDSHSDDTSKPASFTSVDRGWKSEEIKGKFNFEVGAVAHQTRCIKKSQSLGSELFLKERAPDENNVYDGTDQGFSSDSCEQNDWVVLDSGKDSRGIARYQKAPHSESVQVSSDRVNNGSIFSVGDPPHSEKESCQYSDSPLSGDRVDDSGNNTSHTPPGIVKSSSSPNIVGSVPTSGGLSPLKYLTPQSRSSDDIHALDIWRKENQVPVYVGVRQEHGRDGNIHKSEKDNLENFVDDGFDSYNYSALAKDWIVPVTDEVILENFHQGDSSVQHGDDLPSKDYKIKRIEDWVNDLQHCSALVEANELLDCSDQSKRESSVLNDLNAAKVEVKVTPGMEAAKKYISSLSALASAAQLANHGLVVIPFLSAFSSLRVLNLSGNAIVRITAGALPRGLHMLNLSKNNISTIEGLRELTRLRVLDLSYNRIFRIGHGLASCSSLKELYLAGNKISEVEGLHRLLKLTVLDLRGQEGRLQDAIEVLIVQEKSGFHSYRLFRTLGFSTVTNPKVLLRPGTIFSASSDLLLINQRRNLSVVGALSRTFAVPSVSGLSFQVCGYHINRVLSEPSQILVSSKLLCKQMAACGSKVLLGECRLDYKSSSLGHPALSRNDAGIIYKNRGSDSCRKASMSLKSPEQRGNSPIDGYFMYNFAKRWANFSPYMGSLFGYFHSSSTCFSAGTAPDLSFDNSAREEQLSISGESSEQKISHGKTLKLISGSCYLPHPDKEETGGEDAHFICADEQAVGVADGVGGWADLGIDSGQYSRELMCNSVTAIREEPKGLIDPARVLEKAYSSTKAKGSSTACIIALTEQGLHAINLGDSGFMVVRDGCTIFRSPVQQHDFNFTYQLESGNNGDLPSCGQVFTIPVAPGDVIISGTDGLFDNLYNNEITAVVVHAIRAGLGPQVTAQKIAALARQRAQDKDRQTPFSTAAQDAGFRYYGGKLDDITVVVSFITGSTEEKQSS